MCKMISTSTSSKNKFTRGEFMKEKRKLKVIVKNPPTEEQKKEMIKRIEEYLTFVYSNQK